MLKAYENIFQTIIFLLDFIQCTYNFTLTDFDINFDVPNTNTTKHVTY